MPRVYKLVEPRETVAGRTPRAVPARRATRSVVLVLGVLGVGLGLLFWRLRPKPEPSHVQAAFERRVGAEAARQASELTDGRPGRVAVLSLVPMQGPIADRLAGLEAGLKRTALRMAPYDALTGATELYGDRDYDEDYSPSVEDAIRKLSPDVLIVLSGGEFTHLRITRTIEDFIRSGGRLVFVGQIARRTSPLFRLIEGGAAVAIVRNTGPLASRAPRTRTLDARNPEEFFRKYYTVLDADSVTRLVDVSEEGSYAGRR